MLISTIAVLIVSAAPMQSDDTAATERRQPITSNSPFRRGRPQ